MPPHDFCERFFGVVLDVAAEQFGIIDHGGVTL
jgi:hypothetical protein